MGDCFCVAGNGSGIFGWNYLIENIFRARAFIGLDAFHARMFPRRTGQSSVEYLLVIAGGITLTLLMFGLLITIYPLNFDWAHQQAEKTLDEQICRQAGVDFPRCHVDDSFPPGSIQNFNISYTTSNPNLIYFTWVWPADDGATQSGKVVRVEIAYAHDSLTGGLGVEMIRDANQFYSFLQGNSINSGSLENSSTFNAVIPSPGIPGSFAVIPVQIPLGYSGTYYFGIRAVDDATPFPNYSSTITANTYTIP